MLAHSFEVVTNRAFLENELFAIAVGQRPEVVFEIGHEHRNIGLINLRAFFDHGVDDLLPTVRIQSLSLNLSNIVASHASGIEDFFPLRYIILACAKRDSS